MTIEILLNNVGQLMSGLNYHYRFVSVSRLSELESELNAKAREGYFDKEFYQVVLSSFTFHTPKDMENASSIIIIAVPQPIVLVVFEFNRKHYRVRIPPTYDTQVNVEIQHQLEQILHPHGYSIAPVNLPLKLLATRSGLVKYGRNNISYIPGLGSFHRLVAFYSDLPCRHEYWGNPGLLERCNACRTCVAKCPTNAISEERFLLRAEQCLTYHNEHEKDIPQYIDPAWHHCLIGCLICQKYCPENHAFLDCSEERARFSEEETALLLGGIPLDKLPASTRKKLEHLSMIDDYALIARNLSLVFASRTLYG